MLGAAYRAFLFRSYREAIFARSLSTCQLRTGPFLPRCSLRQISRGSVAGCEAAQLVIGARVQQRSDHALPSEAIGDRFDGSSCPSAHVYWSYQTNRLHIGRANLDGTNPEFDTFIAPSGGCGVAVDALVPSTTSITPVASGSRPFGEVLSFTAKVSSAAAGNPAVPTGTVRFEVDGFPSDSSVPLDASGEAHLGAFVDVDGTVSASYGGSASFASSSAQLAPDVRPAATSTALATSASPAVAGAEVTIVATVVGTENDFIPFGSVQFLVNGEAVIEPLDLDDDGRAGIVAGGLDPGTYDVRALYHDDTAAVPDFLDSQAALTQRVTAAPPPLPPLPPPPPPPPTTITPIASPANNAFRLLRRAVSPTGVITLRLRASDAGRYRATAIRCSPSKRACATRSPRFGTATLTARAGRTVTLAVRPNVAARALLARGRALRATVSVLLQSGKGGSARTMRTSLLVRGRRSA